MREKDEGTGFVASLSGTEITVCEGFWEQLHTFFFGAGRK